MPRITYYLLAWTMVLTTVMAMYRGPAVPHWGIAYQCISRGNFAGACKSQNRYNGELTCLRLACAQQKQDGSYTAVYTGPVVDGTLRGYNKVCEKSVCVSLNPNKIVQSLGDEPKFNCTSPPVVQIPPYPSASSDGRNSPKLVIPRSHQPWQKDISSSDYSSSSDDASSTRSGRSTPQDRQRSSPMPSSPRASQRSTPVLSSSNGNQRSSPVASTPKGSQHSSPVASTSKGSQPPRKRQREN